MNIAIASNSTTQVIEQDPREIDIPSRKHASWTVVLLSCVTLGALLVHGYHPNAEDAAIYLPGVEKAIHPELFPFNQQFFASHASLTTFPWIIAGTVKLTRLSLYSALLAWHVFSIFLLLSACWFLAGCCTQSDAGRWTAVVLAAALLTLPVAGTALYIMDQYVNPRNLSAFVGVAAIALVSRKRYLLASMILLVGIAIHPFMAFFAAAYCMLLVMMSSRGFLTNSMCVFMPLSVLYPATSPAYHEVALLHPYHYLFRWQWYEWLGILGPIVMFWWFGRIAHDRGRYKMEAMCRAAVLLGSLSVVAAAVLSSSTRFETLARIQPLRSFHLLYILLLVFSGVLIGERWMTTHTWRWIVVFIPLCTTMFLAQRALFPYSSHIEWPWAQSRNAWVQAFEWARTNTPITARFALDPYYMRVAGEDMNGFRAIAQRSMLADAVKDSGAVSMFPPLAEEWQRQVNAQKDWEHFQRKDFQRLHQQFGVNWVVIQSPGLPELDCPYRNQAVAVCRLDSIQPL